MLKNYFKTALRNLSRNRVYATINILGLVLGITGTIVIYRIISFEKGFDSYHANADQIYRINMILDRDGDVQRDQSIMHPLGPAIALDYPDWTVSRIHWYYDGVFTVNNDQGVQKKFKQEERLAFVEPGFFEMFDFDVIAGDKDELVNEPNTMALSESAADKLFGLNGSNYQSIIGRVVGFENKLNLKITGVYADPPKNTDYGIDYLAFYEGAKIYPYANGLTAWGTTNGSTRGFIKLAPSQSKEQGEALLKASSNKYLGNVYTNPEESGVYFGLQPLGEIHLDPDLGMGAYIDQTTLESLRIIALILILTAAINFINLATAQSVKRAKEIGIRKVMGSGKPQIIRQFLGEVFIITFISIILSLGLSEAALMKLEPFLGYSLGLNLLGEPSTILFLLVLLFSVTVLSGLYPSLVLANYNPIHAIRNSSLTSKNSGKSLSIRRALVVFQFLISQALIIGTLVVLFQMDFMRNQSLGFRSEGVLTFPIPDRNSESTDLLKSRLSSIAGLGEVSLFLTTPGASNINNIDRIKDPRGGDNDLIRANRKNVDSNYGKLFDLDLVAGSFYTENSPDDYSVINEKLAESLGYTNPVDAVGQSFETNYDRSFFISGVVKDFHNNSFHNAIDPIFMAKGNSQYFEGGVAVNSSANLQSIVKEVDELWSEVYENDVFSYDFIEDRVTSQYETEARISELFQVFAGIAIFICCLGLYGLVSFMANQKVKEIGIRKVLGSSIGGILKIFSKEVVILVGLAFALACPLSFYLMNGWLDGYEYRIEMGAKVFTLGLMVTFIIAAVTVGLRVFNAAKANPINSLRDE